MGAAKRLQYAAFHNILVGVNISPTQAHLLFLIKDTQPVSLKQLAENMHLTPGAITQLMDGIDQYVVRKQHADDRRITCISLSSEGVRALAKLKKYRETFMKQVMANFTDQELEVLAKVQQKMVDYFAENCKNCIEKKENVHE